MPIRILIADDNAASLQALTVLLERAGFVAETANDGSEALKRLMGSGFDLTLLDVHMPMLTGLEVLSQLHNLGRRIPSILMTAHPSAAMERAAFEAGAIAMLRKPIQAEILKITVEQVFTRPPDEERPGPGGPPARP